MIDWEDMILARQELNEMMEDDECAGCPYAGHSCHGQCEEVEEHYNPYL